MYPKNEDVPPSEQEIKPWARMRLHGPCMVFDWHDTEDQARAAIEASRAKENFAPQTVAYFPERSLTPIVCGDMDDLKGYIAGISDMIPGKGLLAVKVKRLLAERDAMGKALKDLIIRVEGLFDGYVKTYYSSSSADYDLKLALTDARAALPTGQPR